VRIWTQGQKGFGKPKKAGRTNVVFHSEIEKKYLSLVRKK
jgi:hypothetical protein